MNKIDNTTSMEIDRMQNQFDILNNQLLDLDSILAKLQTTPERKSQTELHRDAIFCMRLGMTFYSEANRAAQAQAWFAAAAIGASALEAVLLAKCLLQSETVQKLPKYRSLPKKVTANFSHFARSLDLGKLLDIANQLFWFPCAGVPEAFRNTMAKHLSDVEMTAMSTLFEKEKSVGEFCAAHLREYRNLLHPAVCLREERQPSIEVGLVATFVFLIAVSALAEGTIS